MPACTSCEASEWLSARKSGRESFQLNEATQVCEPAPGLTWYLCEHHAIFALIAGWSPKRREPVE